MKAQKITIYSFLVVIQPRYDLCMEVFQKINKTTLFFKVKKEKITFPPFNYCYFHIYIFLYSLFLFTYILTYLAHSFHTH